mmetsp:Transcript_25290/g.75925  ORF Transcript_25290/g.75925 Transcript_25290/m.75925 type:complete len:135 (+) Transcript_25290:427-831(+)
MDKQAIIGVLLACFALIVLGACIEAAIFYRRLRRRRANETRAEMSAAARELKPGPPAGKLAAGSPRRRAVQDLENPVASRTRSGGRPAAPLVGPPPDPDPDALDLSDLPYAPKHPAQPGFPRPEASAHDEVNFT